MANGSNLSNFDDALNDFPKSLQDSLKNIIEQEGYVSYKVEKKAVPQNGNFTSALYEVDITGETVYHQKVTSLFIKNPLIIDKVRMANVSDIYIRELFIYNDLFRTCANLQDAANIPEEERFTFLKQYNSENDSVIMENLSKKGFKTYDKTKKFSLRFVELSIIQLAKFHALSYVIKKKIPKYFDDKLKVIKNPINVDSDMQEFIHNICSAIAEVVNAEDKVKISNYAQRMIQTYCKFIVESEPPNGCLCHGDYKFLNILVKEVDGEPSEVMPIDYQLVYYGKPVNDFLFFIFTCTDRDFRREHLSYLKDLYFEQFAKFLGYFNIDANSTYSRQDFESDYEERLELGLVFGLYLSAFTFAHFDEGFDVKKLSLSELPIIPDEMFTNHVRDIVADYIDWGYL